MQTSQNINVTTISDLNDAESGTAFFDATTANKPSGVTDAGTVHTIYQGDIGWQMLIVNDAPREFWQRTRKPDAPHWRTWRKFVDFRTIRDAIDAAISTAGHVDADTVRSLITEHGVTEADARDAAIANAVSSAVSDIPQGLDRAAVETIVDSKLDDELDDERTARNDAINTAVNAATTAIITGRQGAIDASITTERAAIDRSVDSKTGIIDAKVTTLDGKLESERNDRMAAITAEARKRETALNAERSTREAAITAERDARHSAMHAQRTELKNAIANITPDFDAHMATVIQTERSERTAAILAEADKRKTAIAAEADSRDNAIRALDTKVAGDIAEVRRVITGDIATAVAAERDARKAADRAVTTQIANSSFPSGTKMLFRQSTAPTGWTKDTAHNDKALRVVSGSAGSGGTNGFISRFGRGQVRVAGTISGRTAGHAITEAQMARHTHSIPTADAGGTSSTSRVGEAREASWGSSGRAYMTHTGGNQPHSHGAGSLEVASSIALDVAYVDVIIATKD
ncbi:hypothetical protein [Candidatus Puniceispirillum marinum]|uniref:Uncharacterized protein n=1 Tax=Puniceispirillum marinum (strain IMCC1322) TaxID=488538 RepID=D5BPT5_PUNMI|nr:hypothetical protein [Candidatus Puniceispirillum marinum]ADE40587.1 hypothetical protein SAR116_2344 [Candidatus Puniceispirillum marinum IMCC1322]